MAHSLPDRYAVGNDQWKYPTRLHHMSVFRSLDGSFPTKATELLYEIVVTDGG